MHGEPDRCSAEANWRTLRYVIRRSMTSHGFAWIALDPPDQGWLNRKAASWPSSRRSRPEVST